MKFKILKIPLIRICPIGRENNVVLAPNDQRRRLVFSKVLLPSRIERNICLIVVKQLELDRRIFFTGQMIEITDPVVRTDYARISNAMCKLPFDALSGYESF